MTDNKKFFYIYNFHQVKFFLNNGLQIIDIGKGNSGSIYHKFIRDETAEKVFMKWKTEKYGTNAI